MKKFDLYPIFIDDEENSVVLDCLGTYEIICEMTKNNGTLIESKRYYYFDKMIKFGKLIPKTKFVLFDKEIEQKFADFLYE